jgi:superfamily II DNA or RNA helicase
MEIILSNKILIRGVPEELKAFLVNEFKIPNPKFYEAQRAGRYTFNIDEFIYNFNVIDDTTILIPRGYRKQLLDLELVKNEKDLKIIDERAIFDKRKYQYDAVFSLFLNEEESIIVSPAGSGKTIIGLSLIPLFGQPTLWLTHTNPLAMQVFNRARTFLPTLKDDDVGFIKGGKWEKGNILTIALVQTLVRDIEKLKEIKNDFGLVIVDECHRTPSITFTTVVTELSSYYLYGLTATPYRRDGMENMMFQTIGPPNILISTDSVEASGGIIKPEIRYRTVSSKRVYRKRTYNENNPQKLIGQYIIDNKNRNHMIVGDVIAEATVGNFCIVASSRKVHCETLYSLISAGWEKTGIATGDYKGKHVQEQIERLNDKEITVLVTTYSLLGEGFDVPFLSRLFITTPFRNKAGLVQLIGRIQRSHPTKKDAIVFDYVDVDISIFKDQFFSRSGNDSRYKTYESLDLLIEPY